VRHTPLVRRISAAAFVVTLGVAAFSVCAGGRAAYAVAETAEERAAEKFAPAGEGFSASFPAPPEKVVREVPHGGSVITMCNYVLNRDGVDYVVSWMGDFQAELIEQPETQSFFYARLAQNMIKSARAGVREKLVIAEQTEIESGGFTGRRFKFDSPDYVGEMRSYKVGLRFYTAGVFGRKGRSVEEEAGRFLNSLVLKGTAAK
jgi:hypothetical protein